MSLIEFVFYILSGFGVATSSYFFYKIISHLCKKKTPTNIEIDLNHDLENNLGKSRFNYKFMNKFFRRKYY